MRLTEFKGKSNNLQLLKFLAAVFVVASHSFALSAGSSENEWFMKLTDGQMSLGGAAVSIFFCAGGYFIAKSINRVQNGITYFKIRILRIFPCLMVVVFLSAFLLGPMVTEYSIGEYFKDAQVYRYLLNGVLFLQHNLPGVFQNNPYLSTVNGVLWTLPIEFLCYIGCFMMWKFKFLEKKRCGGSIPLVLLGTAGIYLAAGEAGMTALISTIRPMLLFYMGILFFVYRDKIVFTKPVLLGHIAILILSIPLHMINVAMVLCFPYVLFYLCFAVEQVSDKVGNAGNISYGIYLCAYPIQQVIVWMHGGTMSPYWNMVLAIPFAIAGGYLLYRYVEKPLMNFKRRSLA